MIRDVVQSCQLSEDLRGIERSAKRPVSNISSAPPSCQTEQQDATEAEDNAYRGKVSPTCHHNDVWRVRDSKDTDLFPRGSFSWRKGGVF